MVIKEKIVYKVWDKKNQKFICPNGKKSQWNSLTWATEALKDMVKPSYYDNNNVPYKRSPDDFEVQGFKLVMVESIPGREAYEAKEKKAKEIQQIRQQINEVQRNINAIVPDVNMWKIRDMWNKNMFSADVTGKLDMLFMNLTHLENKLK